MTEQLLQIVRSDGAYDKKEEPHLTDNQLLDLYRTMYLVRAFDNRMISLQRQGRIGFFVPALGQEAAHIGAAAALNKEDWIFPAYREHGAAFLRGVSVKKMANNMFGNAEDPAAGRQMPNHYAFKEIHYTSVSSPIGTQIIHAAGWGTAARLQNDPRVALVYFGDGATSSNDFHTGLNFAGVYKSNTVFFCQNNQWAISVPCGVQTASETFAMKADAYGMPGIRVDGNDILAVYKVTREAVERARRGEGPTLIEAFTYRMGPHSTSDDPTRYRPPAEIEEWKKKDPIDRFRLYLQRKGLLTAENDERIRKQIEEQVDVQVKEAEKVPPPQVQTLIEGVYAQIHWILREQMDELLATKQEAEAAGYSQGAH